MSDSDVFLGWLGTTWRDAELALHHGDPAPRSALWSRNEPVSVLGAWRNAVGQEEVRDLFAYLGQSFSDCTSFELELLAHEVRGDLAFTVGLEHTSVSVGGQPRAYSLRVTQTYRREDGEWRVAHRHGDTVAD